MVKVKLFFGGSSDGELDDQVNNFLAEGSKEYVDIKVFGVDNTYATQCSYMAALIYYEEE